jgi:hypothetical protein
MGKHVKTLVVRPQIVRPAPCSVDEDYYRLLHEITHETELSEVRVQATEKSRRQRLRATTLDRTRNRCMRELKTLFAMYLSGDYDRDNDSAISLGQINTIGELLEAEQPSALDI